jgi:hypothetical protein
MNPWVKDEEIDTISSLPNIRAINPPVLVPHMNSKKSLGRRGDSGSGIPLG